MQRFTVFDRQLRPLFDLDGRVTEAMRYERINGEHKLDVKTTQQLEEGLRILVRDGTLGWREWVVDEPDEHKADADIVEGSYGCTWSIQYDLSTVSGGELWPGTYTPITAGAALAMVLATQRRWEVGSVTVAGTAGTSLFDGSVWDYLGKLQEVWGGEIEPRIEVDSNGVTHRYVDWLAHVGSEEATRRFDYGEDCTSIDRKPPVGPMFCRIIPRGGHDATDEDGISYSERVGVEEEPYSSGNGWVHDAGSVLVRDPDAEQVFRTPDGVGGWHYPELVVTYDTDDPEELLQLASADIHKYTRPVPTYEADVLQFAAAGMDAHGVKLGDVVHIVDRKFGDAPLRIEARIVEMTVNELDESDVQLVIGEAKQGIESAFKSMRSAIDAAEERTRRIEGGGTIVYLQHLLDELNAEINGTGGYSYLVPGEGIITYDRRVADPLIGIEATQVTQIKGGNIRIANSKKPSFSGINDWNWKTVIVSGHLAAELVTAANIVAGYIGNASAGSYWNLDTNELQIATGAQIGDTTVSDLLQDVASAGVSKIEYGVSSSSSTAPTSWSTIVPSSVAKGSWLWIRTTYNDGGTSTTKAYAGTDGVGVASTVIEYGTSANAATQPSTWSTTPPTNLPQSTWLWVRTTYTYSNQSTKSVYTKSYVGTDGEDGASVYVTSSTKSGDTTTVVLSDGTTLTIVDGEDGANGTNGLNGYVHTAWANSADGRADFSTTVSANKLYLGVYTDNVQADSQNPSAYSWSLIKGANGEDGVDGVGVKSIVPQYYLSTSSTSATGGSWSNNPPTWSANHYIWTRSYITWDTTPETTSTTTAVYDAALTQANQKAAQAIADAAEAAKVATNYLTFNSTNGLDVGYSGTNAKTRIKGNGVEIFDSAGNSALFAGIESSKSIVRVGKSSGSGNVVMSSDGYVDIRNASTVMAHFGYGTVNDADGNEKNGRYYDIGLRKTSTRIGDYSVVEGYNNVASAAYSHVEGDYGYALAMCAHVEGSGCKADAGFCHAEGYSTKAGDGTGDTSGLPGTQYTEIFCAHAEGRGTKAYGKYSHAEGYYTTANAFASHASGNYTTADARCQTVVGEYNATDSSAYFIVGAGTSSTKKNAFKVASSRADFFSSSSYGTVYVNGTSVHSSDKRLKDHVAYLEDDASDFIRALKPIRYKWKSGGGEHYGFYAQDVQDADPHDTETVIESEYDESLGFNPLSLNYQALIAPLVAYAQQLERRIESQQRQIDQQQETIESLAKRLGALEGR